MTNIVLRPVVSVCCTDPHKPLAKKTRIVRNETLLQVSYAEKRLAFDWFSGLAAGKYTAVQRPYRLKKPTLQMNLIVNNWTWSTATQGSLFTNNCQIWLQYCLCCSFDANRSPA